MAQVYRILPPQLHSRARWSWPAAPWMLRRRSGSMGQHKDAGVLGLCAQDACNYWIQPRKGSIPFSTCGSTRDRCFDAALLVANRMYNLCRHNAPSCSCSGIGKTPRRYSRRASAAERSASALSCGSGLDGWVATSATADRRQPGCITKLDCVDSCTCIAPGRRANPDMHACMHADMHACHDPKAASM